MKDAAKVTIGLILVFWISTIAAYVILGLE